jgi:cytochrome c oxidase subunit 2
MNEFLRQCLFLPPQASTVAVDVDALHYFVILTTFVGTGIVTLVGGYFVIRYRRRPEDLTGVPRPDRAPRTPMWLEWSLITLLVGLLFFWWFLGFRTYVRIRVPPTDAMPIYVTAKQWMWKFAYPQGPSSITTLFVPAGRPVELRMTSRDVIHSFYVPDFRLKQDVIPDRFTTLWFTAPKPGRHQVLCAEYCGTGHSKMRGEVVVLSPQDFERWLSGAQVAAERVVPTEEVPAIPGLPACELTSLARVGLQASAELGCLRCHTLDGTPHIGPTWAGLYKATIPLEGGGQVVADDAYLTESMMDPAAKIHRGFKNVMPSYLGRMDPGQVSGILELIHAASSLPLAPSSAPAAQMGVPPPSTVPMPPAPPAVRGAGHTDGGSP